MFESLRSEWEDLLDAGGARQRLLESHPLRLFYGGDVSSRPILVLVSPVRPALLQFSGAVDVQRGDRGDGSWALAITLLEPALIDTFLGMCAELIRRSSVGNDPSAALDIFFDTLRQWREILGRDPKRLSLEALRGLVAELDFAAHEMSTALSAAEVVAAWGGPFGAPQDFSLTSGELFEVKAVQPGARTVQISSVDQLDPIDEAPLGLVLKTVAESPDGGVGSVNLNALLTQLRQTFPAGSSLSADLDRRLAALGVDENDAFYGERWFVVGAARYFHVRGAFPRLRRSTTPVAIDKVEYRLRLIGISDFEVETTGPLWLPTHRESAS